ncbi:MAG: AAA family ATPase [Bacteroidia bacterium]|nr:AAA family ATPase [Bacteroidia bacterium]
MKDSKYKFKLPTSKKGEIDIPLSEGNVLFVLGANGVGKSTLMQKVFTQNSQHAKRILAHRQTWFTDNAMNITAAKKKQTENNIRSTDHQEYSRWKDDYSHQRTSLSIFDLINSENIRARNIATAVDSDELELAKEHSKIQAPIQAINELLAISNIPVKVILGKDEQLFAVKNGSNQYSIAELSDGERNALLIGADILTTEPNSLIILDEPERHLHRSIISPLLTTLFRKRKDCVFIVSTHDVHLPLDYAESSVLLVRSCNWEHNHVKDWDADLIEPGTLVPNAIKSDILGSKRKILFVEGRTTSLDSQIYQLIYPDCSVIPQGNCVQVEKAVEGIKGTEGIHWIDAFGLIDSDDRTPDQIQSLLKRGIASTPFYSVEALYYHLNIIQKVAKKISDLTGQDERTLYQNATSNIISDITMHKERLCARLCEKKLRIKVMASLPTHKDITSKSVLNLQFDLNTELQAEVEYFENLIASKNIAELLARYPIRETQVLNNIVKGIGLTIEQYESSVRKLIIDESETKEFYKKLLEPLTKMIEG